MNGYPIHIPRVLEQYFLARGVRPGKVTLLLGPRRVGKTRMIEAYVKACGQPSLWLNGEEAETQQLLATRSAANYQRLLGNAALLVIDEAQAVPEAGMVLKLMVDSFPQLSIIASGSAALHLQQQTGEPLTGRALRHYLYPLAQLELAPYENLLQTRQNLPERLVYGSYPEVVMLPSVNEKARYLQNLVKDYLLKDVLYLTQVKHPHELIRLLQLLAYRVGSTVSANSLGNQLQMSTQTVQRYLDLLTDAYVIFPLGAYSTNLDKEVTKAQKWYFWDLGVRNAVIDDFSPVEVRAAQRMEMGLLWENYLVAERLKYLHYHYNLSRTYFWRTADGQEIDWVELSSDGTPPHAYEMKWSGKARAKPPGAWGRHYPHASWHTVTPDNYLDFIAPVGA